MLSPAILPLVRCIEDFLAHSIDAQTFDCRYRELTLSCSHEPWTESEYEILQELFCFCIEFVPDPDLRDSPDDLNDDQLRAEAAQALHALRALSG